MSFYPKRSISLNARISKSVCLMTLNSIKHSSISAYKGTMFYGGQMIIYVKKH